MEKKIINKKNKGVLGYGLIVEMILCPKFELDFFLYPCSFKIASINNLLYGGV